MAEERTKADERWASRALVAMLIREMKDYKAAAEVVSGSDDAFAMSSRQIGDAIARIQEIPTAVVGSRTPTDSEECTCRNN